MDDALQRRLDAIERRVSLLLGLVVSGYALGIAWVLIAQTDVVTPWNAGFAVIGAITLALILGIYRRRQTQQGTL